MYIPSSILPDDTEDQARWREQSLRLRLLSGDHIEDVRKDIRAMFAQEIAADLTISPDLSRNPFKLVYQQLNSSYEYPMSVKIAEDQDLSPLLTPRLWPIQQQNGLNLLALNDSLIRVDWAYWRGATEAEYQIVSPATVVIKPDPNYPDRPIRVEQLIQRTRADGEKVWTWEIWDTSTEEGLFKIEIVKEGRRIDATQEFSPELVGIYPYLHEGSPVMPFILYHKTVSNRLWSWRDGAELRAGALRTSSLWTHWGDGFLSCAHPQRTALDADSQAGVTRNIGGVNVGVIPTDRKSIVKFTSTGPGGGTLSQFSAAMEPRSAAEALELYQRGLALYAGLSPHDLQVTSGMSGYGIVVAREGLKRMQRQLSPGLTTGDQELLSTAAKLSNAYGGTNLPTNPRDYHIVYRGLVESTTERVSKVDTLVKEMGLGLISKVGAIRKLYPDITTDEEAVERLVSVQRTDAIIATSALEEEEATGLPGATTSSTGGGGAPASATALNGAQVTAAQGIVEAVAAGNLPRATGINMLSNFFNIPISQSEAIMGEVGAAFKINPVP